MSDFYEFTKSKQEQSLDHFTPYVKKDWNFITDMNQGSYSNGGQTLVQIDASSIYNSSHYTDGSGFYLAVPIVRVAAYSSLALGGTLVAPTAQSVPATSTSGIGNEFLTTLKWGSWNLISSLEVVINGNTMIQQTPLLNQYVNFKMLSQLSPSDVESFGPSLGCAALDSVNSIKYYGSAFTGPITGNGVCNNQIFPVVNGLANSNAGAANAGEMPFIAAAGSLCYNKGLMARSMCSVFGVGNVTASATIPNIYGTSATLSLFSQTNINAEFKNNYAGVAATYYMVWYDTAIIKLAHMCDFFDKMPLAKKINMLLRIYFNTGTVGIQMSGSTVSTGAYNVLLGQNTTFTTCCPFTINAINNLDTTSVPASTLSCVAGLFIQKAVSTSMLGVNLGLSLASHPMNSVRLYYPQIRLKPEQAIEYASSSRAKKILYKNVLYQQFNNISAQANFSQLVQSGVTRITGVLVLPFVSGVSNSVGPNVTGSTGATNSAGFSCAVSPFDTAPVTSCMSLTQLEVAIGGINETQLFLNYTYENFLEQVMMYGKINSSDIGLTVGLLNQQRFDQGYRYYWIDCSRYTDATANEPRNVNLTFVNNSLQSIDVSVYVEYLTEKVLDCETGLFLGQM